MSLIDVGIGGLRVSQTSLQVTSNNIANADNPSYSRQRVETSTLPEQLSGGGYIGNGNIVDGIERTVDAFLVRQIQLDTATFNNLDIFAGNIEQVDSLLADDFSGLGPAISNFFSSIESSAQDPTSEPARQVVISEADGLSQRLNSLTARIFQQEDLLDDQLKSLTTQISTIAIGIAELNQAIGDQIGLGAGAQPNQLLDQREELLRQLAEIVTVTTVQDGDALNVFIGNGQPLVIGNNSSSLSTVASSREPGNQEIVFVGSSGVSQEITDFISGGKLGGTIDFRDEVIPDVLNSLGRLSIAIADTLNQQNALGIDLDGNLGGNIFRDVNDGSIPGQRVVVDSGNSAPGLQSISINITDVSQLTTSDYVINVVDNDSVLPLDYQIIRTSDNTSTFVNGTVGAQSIVIDGFSIDIPASTQNNLAFSDRFYVRPTRSGGVDMMVDIDRVQELAYALPITTQSSSGNVGSGLISPGQMLAIVDDTSLALSPTNPLYSSPGVLAAPVLIRFDTATGYTVYENSDPFNPEILFTGTIIPGQQNSVFDPLSTDPNYIGFQVEISGVPQAGDEFTIEFNANGSSDNRNAIELGLTRVRDVLDGGATNFENAYGSLIEELGTRTAQARVSRDASESLLLQAQASRDSVSGVNLDEEAANLIKFEQSYNASAQIINVARQIFDILLNAVG